MKLKYIFSIFIVLGLSAIAWNSINNKITDNNVTFICISGYDRNPNKLFPTTYALTPRGKIALVRWKFDWQENSESNNEELCKSVSPRLQKAYEEGSMLFFTHTQENDRSIICTAYKEDGDCATMLFSLRPEDDPIAVLRELTDILNNRAIIGLNSNFGSKRVYFKIANIEKFLETAPVEKESTPQDRDIFFPI